jgi:hypothetical protein
VLDLIAGSSKKLEGGTGNIVEIDETASADANTIAADCAA